MSSAVAPAARDADAVELRRCIRDLVALSTLPAAWMHADPPNIVETLADIAFRMLGLDLAYIRVPAPGRALLESGRSRGTGSSAVRELGRYLERILPFDGSPPPQSIAGPDGRGELALALMPIGHDRDCGWLVAASHREDFPTDHERLLLGVAVNQLALMLQRKAAEALLQDEARTLEILNRVGETVAADLNLERIVQQVTDAATKLTGAQYGAFFYNVVNEKGESYQLYTLSGATREDFRGFPLPRNTAVFAPTFAGTGIVRSDDIRKDPRYGRNAPHRGPPPGHLPVVSYLAVPVVSRSRKVLGGLFFAHSQPCRFDARAERIAAGIAGQAAVAIDNARLYEELRDTATRLAESDRRKDEFLATLAHELRNPLAPMRSAVTLLEMAPAHAELGSVAKAMLGRQVEHLVRLVDDLLDLSRITMGKIELRPERLRLDSAVEAAAETVRPLLERSNQALEIFLPREPVYLDADPVRLAQVFSNLLNNASKYTGNGGKIEIRAEQREAGVEVRVRDNGIGIPAEKLAEVFEMFSQVDSSLEKSHGGLGIGLTIAKRLVELHVGRIEARSEGLGRGSEFVVHLPRAAGERPNATSPGARTTGARNPLRVLVVDDNEDAALALTLVLRTQGHDARSCNDPHAALAAIEATPPDVVLLDIGMPGMSGFVACERIRAQSKGRPPKLIALSGWGQEEHKARARAAGFDHYLVKPVDHEALRLLLETLPA